MPLINPTELLNKYKKTGQAVGAFNVLSLEMIQGVIDAAEETQTPLIIQISTGALKWARFEYIVPMALSAAKNAKVDIAVHLDHCQDVELIKKAVDYGFPSIMYDGSHFDYNRNVIESQEVIKYCQNKAAVEIEIGKVGGKEDDLVSDANETMTLEIANEFYNKTKPNFLAVAFGTAHGVYKGEIKLDFDLIKQCSKKIPVPLVMHGTSGVPFDMIKQAIIAGVTKINVGTDLLIANNKALRKYFSENPEAYDIRKINTAGIIAIKNRVKEYLKLFNLDDE